MGGWLSTFVSWQSIFPINTSARLALPPYPERHRPDPSLLLSAAAEIAAIQRRMDEAASSSTRHVSGMYEDEDFRDENSLSDNENKRLTSSSSDSEDCPDPAEVMAHQRKIFDDQRRKTFPTKFNVNNEQVFAAMRRELEHRCGPSTSIMAACSTRALGCGTRMKRNQYADISTGQRTYLTNKFFPNCRKILDKSRSKMFCCQYVNDGAQIAIASQDEMIRFYEAAGKQGRYHQARSYKLLGVGWSILDVAMSPDGDALAYGTWKEAVVYCRLVEPSQLHPDGISFNCLNIGGENQMAVFSVRFSRGGHEVLAGASDKGLHVFDLATQSKVVTIDSAHDDDINAVCYGDNDSHLLYSAGDDGLVKVWDRRALGEGDSKPVGVFAGHRDGVTFLDSRGDNRFLISNSKDQTIKLWDLRCFSTDAAAVRRDKTKLCVQKQAWDYRWQLAPKCETSLLPGDTSVVTLSGHSVLHTLIRARFSPERTGQRYVYTGCARGEVVVYDLLTGDVAHRLPGHVAVVRDTVWHPNSNEIVSCSWDGMAAMWRWDERRDHVTSKFFGEEESCDELYVPTRRKKVHRRSKRRRTPMGDSSDDDSS